MRQLIHHILKEGDERCFGSETLSRLKHQKVHQHTHTSCRSSGICRWSCWAQRSYQEKF